MRLKVSVLIFLFLILSSFVAAVPPSEVNDDNLFITFPPFEYGKVSTSLQMPFHVYTSDDGLALNESVSCTLHIYKSTGEHIYINTTSTPVNTYDYIFDINDTVFDEVGKYSFNIYCNCSGCAADGSDLGGVVEHPFFITADGEREDKHPYGWLPVIAVVALVMFGFFTASRMSKSDLLRLVFFFISIFHLLFLSWLSYLAALNPARVDLAVPVFEGYLGVMIIVAIGVLWMLGLLRLGNLRKMYKGLRNKEDDD